MVASSTPDHRPTRIGRGLTPRLLAGVVALAVLSLAAGGRGVADRAHQRRTPAQICQKAVKRFAQLPPPASLQDIPAGIDKTFGRTPSNEDVNAFPISATGAYSTAVTRLNSSGLMLNPLRVAANSITQAVQAGDGPLANKLMADLHAIFTAIDRAQKKDKLPAACASQAWGATYFAPVAALIEASMPLTGTFTTDMTAACTRLTTRAKAIPNVDVTDPSSVRDFITNYDNAFRALQVDAETITPPPGNPPDYVTFRKIIDQAVTKLDKASDPHTTNSQLRTLGAQLTGLAQPITAAAAALGVNC
jgi:hypothetical protein